MFWLVLATLILPPEVRAVALFLMLARAPLAGGNGLLRSGGTGLFNARPGVVAPYAMSGIGIFFTRQSFLGPPDELEEARRLEGAWEWSSARGSPCHRASSSRGSGERLAGPAARHGHTRRLVPGQPTNTTKKRSLDAPAQFRRCRSRAPR